MYGAIGWPISSRCIYPDSRSIPLTIANRSLLPTDLFFFLCDFCFKPVNRTFFLIWLVYGFTITFKEFELYYFSGGFRVGDSNINSFSLNEAKLLILLANNFLELLYWLSVFSKCLMYGEIEVLLISVFIFYCFFLNL